MMPLHRLVRLIVAIAVVWAAALTATGNYQRAVTLVLLCAAALIALPESASREEDA